MKTIIALILTAVCLNCSSVFAQEGTKKREALQKKAGKERSRSVSGQRTESELKDDKGEVPQSNAKDVQQGASDDQQSKVRAHGNQKDSDAADQTATSQVITPNENQPRPAEPRKTNAPAVIQVTPSESGSPAMPAPDNGYSRDGTNTMQRSRPNIAGAEEPGNMNLSDKNNSQRNIKSKDVREQGEQPQKDISKAEQQRNKQVVEEQQDGNQEKASPKEERKEKREKRRKDRKKDDNSGK